MTRLGKGSQTMKAILTCCYCYAMLAPKSFVAEARSWWSLDIPALGSIRDADPLYAASSTLLMEDTGFLYGFELADDHVKSSPINEPMQEVDMDPLTTYSTPAPSITEGQEPSAAPTTATPITATPITATATPSNSNSISSATNLPTGPPVQKVGPFPNTPQTSSPLATAFPTINHQTEQQPTFSPSKHFEAANGSCPPNHILHRLWLYDSAGDGWGSTKLVIKETSTSGDSGLEDAIFVGGLDAEKGVVKYESSASIASAHDKNSKRDDSDRRLRRLNSTLGESSSDESVHLCLEQDVCYTAEVSGGTFLEEAHWEITRVELGTGDNIGLVAEGVGEGSGICDFSLDGSCVKTCDGTAQILQPTSNPTTPVPSQSPKNSTDAPIGTPTQSPFMLRSKKPATASPTEILPQDKKFSFGFEAYKRIQTILLSASPSSDAALADENSPQSRAFEWIYSSNASGLSDRQLVQRWVLASFYYSTEGDDWIVKNGWMESGDECQWYGVSCLAGIISKLELEQNRLIGDIVPEIAIWGNYLYVLSLGNDYGAPEEEKNQLVMPLPSFLGDLIYLSFLNLEGVGMTSTIPEELFSSWPHLKSLYLNDNDITGALPKSIKHLSSIEVLWLGGNNLGGSIIPEIGQLSTLKDLSLESNYRDDAAGKRGFITTVPPEIGQLTNLEMLSLADNALSGQVPMQLGDLISLRRLQLSGNFFESQLPSALGRLEMLEELDISFNWLSSTIPAEYGNMISLTSLSLHSNYNDKNGYFTWGIKSKLPTELGKLKNLQHINLSDNYLTGTLITEIGQLYLLKTMNLQNNFLQGSIPKEYSNCVSMKEILLQENNIDGESFGMPEEICRLPELDLARVDCEVSCSCCLTTC